MKKQEKIVSDVIKTIDNGTFDVVFSVAEFDSRLNLYKIGPGQYISKELVEDIFNNQDHYRAQVAGFDHK